LLWKKVQKDLDFRERLLGYIERVCCQCMPNEIMDDSTVEPGGNAFQLMLPPDHPAFEEAMKLDVFDIVTSRQMQSEHHNPTCFKYGKERNVGSAS